MTEIAEKILRFVEKDINSMSSHIAEWAKSHLIEPKKIELFEDLESEKKIELWLVTDHNGNNDSGYRVVFDETENDFGLEITLDNGRKCFMGLYGSFGDTVENM